MELGQNRVVLSPEDVAWADSCFSKDPEMSDSDWDSLKYSLLETLDTQNRYSSHERESSPEVRSNMEISSSEDDSDGEEPTSDYRLNHDDTDDFWSRHKREDVFLPTYNENARDFLGLFDPEVDFVFQAFEVEDGLSSEDIFKTWDLDIAPEEDDASVQLIKSLAWQDLLDDSLDDLISGIAGLNLSPKTG